MATAGDPLDARLVVASLTREGRALATRAVEAASQVTADTLAPLTPAEQQALLALLRHLR